MNIPQTFVIGELVSRAGNVLRPEVDNPEPDSADEPSLTGVIAQLLSFLGAKEPMAATHVEATFGCLLLRMTGLHPRDPS